MAGESKCKGSGGEGGVSCVGVAAECAGVCVSPVQLCLRRCAYLIENVTAFMKLSICNTNTNALTLTLSFSLSLSLSFSHLSTPTAAHTSTHTHPPAGVDDTHIWHIYIQLVCKCKFPSPASPFARHTHRKTHNKYKKTNTHTHKLVKLNVERKTNWKSLRWQQQLFSFDQAECPSKENNFGKCINQIWNMY